MKFIQITSPPKGNAPQFVRKAWLGLKLPLVKHNSKIENRTEFLVEASQALPILYKSSPKAANWWRMHLPSAKNNLLVFPSEVCRLINR